MPDGVRPSFDFLQRNYALGKAPVAALRSQPASSMTVRSIAAPNARMRIASAGAIAIENATVDHRVICFRCCATGTTFLQMALPVIAYSRLTRHTIDRNLMSGQKFSNGTD